MKVPTTEASSEPADQSTDAVADALVRDEVITFRIDGSARSGSKTGYSILLRGDVQASSILSTRDPEETVTLLEDDTKILSGSVRGETAGFVIDGDVLAAEFDDPVPRVEYDGATVDPSEWPTVKEYTGFGPGQEPVEEPFPNSGELGKPPGDPLDPEEYVISLDGEGLDEARAYCFDVDGEVLDAPDSATVSPDEDRVYGYLCPGWSETIEIRGVVTRIDSGERIDVSVRERE